MTTVVPSGQAPGRVTATARRVRSWLRITTHPSLHQTQIDTHEDRYPEVFSFVAARVAPEAHVRVLSFGCSTGEECVSLRRYLPSATIVGVDVDRSLIRIAKRRNRDPRTSFLTAGGQRLGGIEPFDVVFAMSVLCRWPATKDATDCRNIYPFRRFTEAVEMLGSLVVDRGLLVIFNANFRVTDTPASADFTPLEIPGYEDSGFVRKFSPDNRPLDDQHYPYSVFLKAPTGARGPT